MNSGICSRSACQNLHDQLYGDLGLSVRRERAEISTCFNRVNEYLREQAQAQQQEKQEEEDRKASEAADERAGQRQENDRKAEDAKDQAARDNSSGAAVPLAPPSVQPQPSTIRQSRTVPKDLATEVQARAVVEQEKKERANEATARMVDPFSSSAKVESASNRTSGKAEVVDPFPPDRAETKDTSSEYANDAIEIEAKFVEKGIGNAESVIKQNAEAAKKIFSGDALKAYEKEADHSFSFVEGLDRGLVAVKYGADLGTIIVASDDRERSKAYSDMFVDLAKDGFTAVAKRLSPRLGSFLEGPIGWIAGSTFDSTEVGLDPIEIVNDSSGRYKFDDKQKALDSLILQYNRHRDIWGKAQVQWLMQSADKIYSSPDNPKIRLSPP